MAKAVEQVLLERFPGAAPDGLVDHLSDLVPAALSDILRKSVAAGSLEEALGKHMPVKVPSLNG